jgi:hypothetical protein
MTSSHENDTLAGQKYFSLGSPEDVRSAIDLIFEAFENACDFEEAVLLAKKNASKLYDGKEKDRTLVLIEQLGFMMDHQYWKKKKRTTSYLLS